MKLIKGQMHGADRADMRLAMNTEIRNREKLRKANKLGKLIELLSCRPPEDLYLQTLPCPVRGQIVDHYANQETLNAYFYDWHAISKDHDPAAN